MRGNERLQRMTNQVTLMKFILSLIIIAVAIESNGQSDNVNKQIQVGVSAGYGSLNWTTKYSVELSSNPQSDYPRDTNFKNTGNVSSMDIYISYMMRKCGFGVLIGRRNYQIDELITDLSPQFTMQIPDDQINLYGGLFNYEIFQAKNFKIRPEIGVGIYTFKDKNVSKVYDNKFFANSNIKFEYHFKNLSFSVAPAYEFVNSKFTMKLADGTTITNRNLANSITVRFGVAYKIPLSK
jgi:hypothetical protein